MKVTPKGSRLICLQAQEHEFNMPLQLGDAAELEGVSTAEDADTYTIALQRQDIIVMASDGILDNLWIDDMSQIIYTVLKVALVYCIFILILVLSFTQSSRQLSYLVKHPQ